jgi:predicted nucleic acid-binding protein
VPKYLFDTNLVKSKAYDPKKLPETTYASSVVLFELMTSCNDMRERRAYEASWRDSKKDGVLIIPNEEDWLAASKISFTLAQERKQQAGGNSPKLSSKIKQEIALDCLIAISAARNGIIVLTLNKKDFEYIKRHCKDLEVQEYPKGA